jgi:hypothetical protein
MQFFLLQMQGSAQVAGVVAIFNQISANKANFMVKINTFLG